MSDNVDYSAVFGTAFPITNPMNINDGAIIIANPNHMWSMSVVNATNIVIFKVSVINQSSIIGIIRIFDNTQVQLASVSANTGLIILSNVPVGTLYFELVLSSGASIYEYAAIAMIYENGVAPTIPAPTAIIDITPKILNSAPTILPIPTLIEDNTLSLNGVQPLLNPVVKLKHLGNRSESIFSNSVISQFYHIKGTVSEGGTIRAGVLMRLYDRNTGDLMGETYSDASGNWIFNSVFLEISKKYYVVAFDDETLPIKQAEIHDFLIPIAV